MTHHNNRTSEEAYNEALSKVGNGILYDPINDVYYPRWHDMAGNWHNRMRVI